MLQNTFLTYTLMKPAAIKSIYVSITAMMVWFALGLQLKLSIGHSGGNIWHALKLYLSFFTILTNILVACCLTFIIFFKGTGISKFFSKASTQTAIAVYILVVGLVYNISLRGLTHPVGLDRVADELLHVASPLLFLCFWIFFVKKAGLDYKDAVKWLIYPLLYVLLIVVRGYIINAYPYPFINVVNLGYPKALLNTGIILLIMWVLSLLFIFIGKKMKKI